MSEGVDAKQFGFSLVALALGACILFVAGLQLGQKFDVFGDDKGKASVESPRTPVKGQRAGGGGSKGSEFSFFSDLKEPDRGPAQRRMPVLNGNANNKDRVSPAKARRALARSGGKKARTLKRKARGKVASKSVGRAVLASPSLVGREVKKDTPSGVPVGIGRRILRKDGGRPAQQAVGQRAPTKKVGARKYTVQAGSFGEYGDAFELAQRLRTRGHKAHVILVDKPGQGRRYKVRMGRFSDRDAASRTLQKVQAEGVSASITSL